MGNPERRGDILVVSQWSGDYWRSRRPPNILRPSRRPLDAVEMAGPRACAARHDQIVERVLVSAQSTISVRSRQNGSWEASRRLARRR